MTEYFSIKQAMNKMKMSRTTIMRLIREGTLKTYQPGGKNSSHKITQEQIDQCIQGDANQNERNEQ